MGKAKQLKKIRAAAKQLPVIATKKVIGEVISGAELFKSGTETLEDGTKVDVDKNYRKKHLEDATLNHNRKMKQMYNKFGMAGAMGYAKAVVRYVASKEVKPASE